MPCEHTAEMDAFTAFEYHSLKLCWHFSCLVLSVVLNLNGSSSFSALTLLVGSFDP